MDLIGVAKSFGLLRLPRMPELKDVSKDAWLDAEVDVRVPFTLNASFYGLTVT